MNRKLPVVLSAKVRSSSPGSAAVCVWGWSPGTWFLWGFFLVFFFFSQHSLWVDFFLEVNSVSDVSKYVIHDLQSRFQVGQGHRSLGRIWINWILNFFLLFFPFFFFINTCIIWKSTSRVANSSTISLSQVQLASAVGWLVTKVNNCLWNCYILVLK